MSGLWGIGSEGLEQLFQLNNVLDGFWDGRGFEFFSDRRIFGLVEFSGLIGDPNDKRECTFKQKDDGGHLCEDIGSLGVKDSGFV